eukprot:SAG31_NODE_611_length_13558_cov_224.959730_8_plen_145_part_00
MNGGGGAITGKFDRTSLTLIPDRPHAATNSYGYGSGAYPKTYVSSDGRRIFWRWIGAAGAQKGCNRSDHRRNVPPKCWWWGMQSVPTVMTPAAPDDITNTVVAEPVEELAALRVRRMNICCLSELMVSRLRRFCRQSQAYARRT